MTDGFKRVIAEKMLNRKLKAAKKNKNQWTSFKTPEVITVFEAIGRGNNELIDNIISSYGPRVSQVYSIQRIVYSDYRLIKVAWGVDTIQSFIDSIKKVNNQHMEEFKKGVATVNDY